jgi:hypothetical protein
MTTEVLTLYPLVPIETNQPDNTPEWMYLEAPQEDISPAREYFDS